MDLLVKIRTDLNSKRGRAREVADGTGLPLSTIYRIRDETTPTNPRYDTVEKLRVYYATSKRASA